MTLLISHFLLSVLFACLGLGGGWWLHGRITEGTLATRQGDTGLARDLLSSLRCLAVKVAADVNEHNASVGEVDKQLAALETRAPSTIDELVSQLLKANEHVQQKLTETETKLETLSQQLEVRSSEARTDALTGLANRRMFEEESTRLLQEFQQSDQEFSMLIVDIDKFKVVNDDYGHSVGDEILRGVAQILLENMRGRDVVTRYGGEEFAIIMPNTALGDARRAAEMVREAIEKTRFQIGNQSLGITISVGVAEVLAFEDVAMLAKRADQAMYAAKHAGRNRGYWHDGTLAHPICLPESRSGPTADASERIQECPRLYDRQPARVAGSSRKDRTSSRNTALLTAENVNTELLNNMGNKTMFCQDIRRRIAEWNRGGTVFSVILLSVDKHADLTKKHGESVSKLVLGAVAQAVENGLRDMDLIARYNNSSFGLVLPKAPLRNAICVGERLRKAIGDTGMLLDDEEIHFTASLGIVEVTEGDEMATLVERARAELGLASRSGGNRSGFATSVPTAAS